MNDTLERIYTHRTIRAFKNEPLSKEQVDAIVRAGQHAPTYSFFQAYSIIGITDQEKKDRLAEICNQAYVADTGYLFLIVCDWARNEHIAKAKDTEDTSVLGSTDRFLASFYDAAMVTMNMITAAESMGLGTVPLGSVNNDMQAVIDLFELPPLTFPCLGLGVGIADQSPQLKPRLPQEVIFMENRYQPLANPLEDLADYDEAVHDYYDLRDANRRVDRFTDQMVRAMSPNLPAKRKEILSVLKKQGLILD